MGKPVNGERVNIYVSGAIRELMREVNEKAEAHGRRINWSSVASAAFYNECQQVNIREELGLDIDGDQHYGTRAMLLDAMQNLDPSKAKKLLLALISQLL